MIIPNEYIEHEYEVGGGEKRQEEIRRDFLRLQLYLLIHNPRYITYTNEVRFGHNEMLGFLNLKKQRRGSEKIKMISVVLNEFINEGILNKNLMSSVDLDNDEIISYKCGEKFTPVMNRSGGGKYTKLFLHDMERILAYKNEKPDKRQYNIAPFKILQVYLYIKMFIWEHDRSSGGTVEDRPSYCWKRYESIAARTGIAPRTTQYIVDILVDQLKMLRKQRFVVGDKETEDTGCKCYGNIYVLNHVGWQKEMESARAKILSDKSYRKILS